VLGNEFVKNLGESKRARQNFQIGNEIGTMGILNNGYAK
jgi:hypothetical protein